MLPNLSTLCACLLLIFMNNALGQSLTLPMFVCLIGHQLHSPPAPSMLLSLISIIIPAVQAGSHCVFPSLRSTYEAESGPIVECTFNPVREYWWCPTTEDYGRDKQWMKCPKTFTTYAGNRPGYNCHLPFIHNKVLQHACIRHEGDDQEYWWCATTDNYDRDREWTKCKMHSSSMPCAFKSKARGVHKQCAQVGGEKWICTTKHGTPRVCPETEKTFGGNDPGNDCKFPFYYRKEEHFECVNSDRGGGEGPYKWCATTENYDADLRWTRCKESDMHKGLRFVIRIIIIAGGSLGGVIVVGCVLYYACDPVRILQMTLKKRKPRPTNEVQLQTEEDDFQCERNPLTPSAPPPPSYEEAVLQRTRTYNGGPEAPV